MLQCRRRILPWLLSFLKNMGTRFAIKYPAYTLSHEHNIVFVLGTDLKITTKTCHNTIAEFLVATHDYGKEDKLGIGFVTSYIIEPDGNLTKINTEATEGRGNSCVTFHNSGKYILVTQMGEYKRKILVKHW